MATTEVDYRKRDTFNKAAFMTAYTAQFKSVPKYIAASIPDLVRMVEMMEQDPTITDIRWMAYMLATTFIESAETVRVKRTTKDKKGHPVVRTAKVWRNFAPIEEKGHGQHKRYYRPAKVKELPDGTVRVTEWDGDQWTVSKNGHQHRLGVNWRSITESWDGLFKRGFSGGATTPRPAPSGAWPRSSSGPGFRRRAW